MPAFDQRAQLYIDFLSTLMQPLMSFWGGNGRSEKRMRRNSVLIPSHMNPTCSAVKLDGFMIMMSEFGPSAGQQLALLATLHWLTHVAFSNKGSKYVPYAQCQRNLRFLRKHVGKHLAGLVSGSKREAGMKHRLLFSNLFMAALKFGVNISLAGSKMWLLFNKSSLN